MKNTSSGPEESFFKKKGFFIALYSTLGAVMVLALVITFTNLMTGPSDNEQAELTPEESVNVGADDVVPYEQAQAQMEQQDNETAWWRSTPKPTVAPPTVITPPPFGTPAPVPAVPAPTAPAAPGQTVPAAPPVQDAPTPTEPEAPAPTAPEANTETVPEEPVVTVEAPPVDTPVAEAPQEASPPGALAFTPFAENDKLTWPVEGELAMAFNMTMPSTYNPTLDKWSTNDDIRISAKEGTPVKSAANGQVVDIGYNMEDGTFITIDHGNGYKATYGQLMEGVLVDKGEVVSAGQVIGGVGQPSPFGSLNGTHVNLKIAKDDVAIDPTALLAVAE
jgi:murein DD-endopeptidase MepM/ murein hydrolase activator NlpD